MKKDLSTKQPYKLPDPQIGFFELGMDSLMAAELHTRLTQMLGVPLPSTLVFDFPNIERLTNYIASEVLKLSIEDERPQPVVSSDNKLNEPIAIIGMGCSFPGGASDPESFWQMLQGGISAREEIPRERWDIETYYDPNPEAPGKISTRYGHFVASVDQFDPDFFGISPREALAIDPQHRLLLEVSWQAMERAGQAVERLAEEHVGVFVGTNAHDYEQLLQQHLQQQPDSPLATYAGTGTHPSSAAGRLAYSFGFTGPALTIDTACSASLVAIHQACNSLRLGECQMALTGGVLLNLTPASYIATSRARMISADGQCKAFDAAADGYGRGEGCGMVVLKRLSQAQQDGDQILALIRGSAVNQDGPSSSLTVPNGQSQQRMMKQALIQAQVKPAEITYLEAHGTGTSLGDPIEVNAAASVLGQERPSEQPLWIGSVKTNIGHLEAAAGVSGLIKVVLSMQHQQIPAHLHFQNPNSKISWQPWLQVPQTLTPWKVSERRLAGVSSFGFTGTNAHVVLEEAPPVLTRTPAEYQRPVHLLKLSAKNNQALTELAQRYSHHLDVHLEQDIGDICFTANSNRLSHSHRLAVVAQTREDLQEKLNEFVTGAETIGLVSGIVSDNEPPKVAILFTGQGSQYVGMGRQLYETQPTFKKALDKCAAILNTYLDKSLIDILYSTNAEKAILDQTAYTQPALFALEYSLYQLWRSWGIQPDVVMGHSVGEYVAACVAGVFSLEDGLKLIANRGKLMQQLPSGGVMVSLMAAAVQVRKFIASYPEVAIAAINGPESTVISGSAGAVHTVVTQMEQVHGIKSKNLMVSHGFHSPLMQPIIKKFEQVLRQITYSPPKLNFVSNLSGQLAEGDLVTPEYWCQHILSPVNFARGMEVLPQLGCEVFLECGPQPLLLGMGRQCLPDGVGLWLPSLRSGQEDWQQMLTSLGELYIKGVKIDWRGFERDYPQRRKVTLPTYPFQRQSYWVETKPSQTRQTYLDTSSLVMDLLTKGDLEQLTQLLTEDGQSSVAQTMLTRLVNLHQQQHNLSTLKDAIYELAWISSARPEPDLHPQPGHWLIFANSGDLVANLSEQLEQFAQTWSLVSWENHNLIAELSPTYKLQPELKSASFDALWPQLESTQPISGIIWLETITEKNTSSDLTSAALEVEVNSRCQSLLFLMQSLVKQPQLARTKLWIATRNAVAYGAELPALSQGGVWGLSRIFGLEHPQQWGGLIDFDQKTSMSEQARALALEVLGNQTEEQVAYRDNHRSVVRLVPSKPLKSQPLLISSEGSYLISGGTGGLGLAVAQWLVKQGARHLVLLSRGGVNTAERESIVAELKAADIEVFTPLVDVSDEKSLAAVIEDLPDVFLPIKGVVHAAGIEGGEHPIAKLDPALLQETLRPKVQGTWNLHQLTLKWKLDFFVNFSSIAAVWGSAKQAHYGAANEFQNLFAQYRLAKGMPVLTINWSAIKEAGIIHRAGEQAVQKLTQIGVESMSLQQMTAALELLLGHTQGQRVVATVDWQRLDTVYQGRRSRKLLEQLVRQSQLRKSSQNISLERLVLATETESTLTHFDELLAATPGERKELITIYLQRSIAKVLGFLSARLPTVERNLLALGMDSLMMMQVLSQIKRDLKLMIYPREFYDRPRIDYLADYLATEFTQMHGQGYNETSPSYSTLLGVDFGGISLQENNSTSDLDYPKLPGAVFILSPPRSGSTLLRVMLAGHSALFSPPELHLLPFVSMGEREKSLGATYLQEGLQKALMELMDLDSKRVTTLVQEFESQNLSIYEMYAFLQKRVGKRLLVDKSPTYALKLETLQRAEAIFQRAKYIHLTRHPYASIESFAQLRLDKLFGIEQSNPYRIAEQFWVRSHQNILNFAIGIDSERYHLVQYEDLVQQPEQELKHLCKFLEINFVPELLEPYEGNRMVKGVHKSSAPIGDPNFFSHNSIDASLAETWKHIQLPHLLTQEARKIAQQLKYVLPQEQALLNNNVDNWEEIEL